MTEARTGIGQSLRWARKRAGMTQADLAQATGMPQSTVARIERGTVVPRAATLLAMLEATGHELVVERRIGADVDRRPIRLRLAMLPPDRVRHGLEAARRGRRRQKGPDPIRIVRRLRRFGVRFVLIGEMAEAAHGSTIPVPPRVEICHAQDGESLDRLTTALQDLGASPMPERTALEGVDPLTISCSAGTLRLDARPAGPTDGYEILQRTAKRMLVGTGLLANVASLEDLLQIRRRRGTPDDREALELLGALRDELAGPNA